MPVRLALSGPPPFETSVAGQSTATPQKAAVAAAPTKPVQGEVMMEALSLGLDGQIGMVAMGQEEGVVALRALSSSRGGMRAPTVTATPTVTPTSQPNPTPTAMKEALKPSTYKVAPGDTLVGIADKFGITPETILWANDLGNGELIQIDQELVILPVSGVVHRVRKGETFNAIAEAYGADVKKLIEANALTNADLLKEDQPLIVPGGMLRTTEISGLPVKPSQRELDAAPKYVVRDGDTLVSIADSYGVRVSVIQVANDLMDPDMVKVGQELVIPGGTAPSRQAPAPTARPQQPAPTTAPSQPAAPKPTATPKPAPQPQPAPAPTDGSKGAAIVSIAQQYLGYRYVWGGTSPKTGFDCSGYTWYVYGQVGLSIPRYPLESQIASGPRISMDQLRPGDLLFWQNTYKAGLSHTGIYIGGGRFIHAESEATGVQIRSLSEPFWSSRYVGASRPW